MLDADGQLCERVFVTGTASILHADLDSFYASVEQRDDPALRGRPVAAGGGVVLAASYEAKRFGVRTAMSESAARRLCPELVVVPARFDAYTQASQDVFAIFHDTSPLVEGISISEHLVLSADDSSFFVDWKAADEAARQEISKYSIKGAPASPAEALSGGNQQRLLLAMIPDEVRLLLLEHPTRGLDVESAAYVWQRLLERRSVGTSIIFASADLDELLRYSDRIVVFFAGAVFAVRDTSETDGEELGYLIGGKERV